LKDQRKFGLFSLGATPQSDLYAGDRPSSKRYHAWHCVTTFRVQLLGFSICFFANMTDLKGWRVVGLGVWEGLAF
jgi:hypothetical protein